MSARAQADGGPDASFARRLDPRTKLAFQAGFAVAAFTVPVVPWLAILGVLALVALRAAEHSLREALLAFRYVLLVLAIGPLLGGLVLGPPWFRLDPALVSLRSVARVVTVLLVSAAAMHATPVRATRAAIQRTVPGRVGRLLGVGVALTVRFVPVLRADVARLRTAIRARGGETRSLRDRARRLTTLSVLRALGRADRLSAALRARCFSYNPTLPALRFSRRDYPVLALSALLAVAPLVRYVW